MYLKWKSKKSTDKITYENTGSATKTRGQMLDRHANKIQFAKKNTKIQKEIQIKYKYKYKMEIK